MVSNWRLTVAHWLGEQFLQGLEALAARPSAAISLARSATRRTLSTLANLLIQVVMPWLISGACGSCGVCILKVSRTSARP